MAEPIILAQAKAARGNPDPVGLVLSRLEGVQGSQARGRWKAHCPAHDDNIRSLSIGVGRNGDALLKCHANCPIEKIVEKIGLSMTDLFVEERNGSMTTNQGAVEAIYNYTDLHGQVLHQTLRYRGKGFSQRHPNGQGYVNDLNGVETVLYRLSDLVDADPTLPVYVVEGEKDVERLVSLGQIATTNPMGASHWRPEYNHWLKDRDVIILPDNDTPGRDHATHIARALYGTAASVKIVELPGLPEKGDVSDFLDAGWTIEGLRKLVQEAPAFSQFPDLLTTGKVGKVEEAQPLRVVRVWERPEPPPRRWLIENMIPEGVITALFGDGGMGKSYIALYFCMLLCKGQSFGYRSVIPSRVLYLDAELDEDEFERRAYKVARGLGWSCPPEGLHYYNLPDSIAKTSMQYEVASIIADLEIGFTLLDSLSIGGFGTDPKDAKDQILILKEGMRHWGTVAAIDHITKPPPGANLSTFTQFGSGFKRFIARASYKLIQAPGGGITLQNDKMNFGARIPPIYMSMEFGEDRVSFGHVDADSPWMAGIDEHLPMLEQVYQLMAQESDGKASVTYLADQLKKSPKTISNYLTALHQQGRADSDNTGVWEIKRPTLTVVEPVDDA